MKKLYKPKEGKVKVMLDEQLSTDRPWYYIEITDNKVVRVWNKFAERYVKVNERGFFRGTPKQIEILKSKLREI